MLNDCFYPQSPPLTRRVTHFLSPNGRGDYTHLKRESAQATHHYPILRDQDQFSSNRLRLIAGRRPSGATFREVRKRQVVMWLLVVVNWKGHLITYLTASRKYLLGLGPGPGAQSDPDDHHQSLEPGCRLGEVPHCKALDQPFAISLRLRCGYEGLCDECGWFRWDLRNWISFALEVID